MIPTEDFERRIAPGGIAWQAYQDEVFAQWAKARARQEVAGGTASGWTADIDVMTLADPAPPCLFWRANDDGTYRGYGYPAGLHLLYGARKSGKTMLAFLWAAQLLNAGGGVVWYAFERQQGVRERLALAGARDLSRFRYREASGMPSAAEWAGVCAGVQAAGVSLVVFDAFRGLQAAVTPGTSANDGDAVELVNSRVLVPLQRAGAAVLVIDHQSKDGGGASAFGSERKESMADVVLSVEAKVQFSREREGWSKVTATADRYGFNDDDSPGYLVMIPGHGIQFRHDIPVDATPAAFMGQAEDAAALRQRQEVRRLRELEVHEAVMLADDWTMASVAEYLKEHCKGKSYSAGDSTWRTVAREMLLSGQLRAALGPRTSKLLRPGPGGVPAELQHLLTDPAIAARVEGYRHDILAI